MESGEISLAIHTKSNKCVTRQAQPAGDFLWVNHEENSQDASSRAKQAFIRRRYHRLKKETELEKLKTSMTPPPSKLSKGCRSSKGSKSSGPAVSDRYDKSRRPSVKSELLHHPKDIGLIKAFPSLSLSTEKSADFYLRHYNVFVSKSCYPLSSSDMFDWLMKMALDKPALVEAMLLMSASSRTTGLWVRGAPSHLVHQCAHDALQLRSRAYKSLQNMLQSPEEVYSELTVLVITHLLCIEGSEGNLLAVQTHAEGLKNIINAMGGVGVFSEHTLSTIYSCDLMIGFLKRGPPIFEICQKWENKIHAKTLIHKASCLFNDFSHIGSRFFDSPWSADVHPELQNIIRSFQQMIPLIEAIYDKDSRLMKVENDHLLLLALKLLSMPYDHSLKPCDNMIRASVLLYCAVRVWNFRGKKCMEYAIKGIQEALEECVSFLDPGFLFWLYFLSALGTEGLTVHQWSASRLQSSARQLGLEDWASALQTLQGYLFVPRHKELGKELWESLFGNTVETLD